MKFLIDNSLYITTSSIVLIQIYTLWYEYIAKINKFDDNELMYRWIQVQKYKQRMNK